MLDYRLDNYAKLDYFTYPQNNITFPIERTKKL